MNHFPRRQQRVLLQMASDPYFRSYALDWLHDPNVRAWRSYGRKHNRRRFR